MLRHGRNGAQRAPRANDESLMYPQADVLYRSKPLYPDWLMKVPALDIVKRSKQGSMVNKPFRNEMGRCSITLPDAIDRQQCGVEHLLLLLLHQTRPDNDLRRADLVLNGHKHDAVGRARSLPAGDDPRGPSQLPVWKSLQFLGRTKIHRKPG